MNKYKCTLAYDGTQYGGWQVQKNTTTIQDLIQQALTTALRQPIQATGAGRTDAGVHALAQVAHFSCAEDLDTERLIASLNGLLPNDIRVKEIASVAPDFHARYSASGKIYHYHIHLDRVMDPFKRLYSHHVLHPVDLSLLAKGAKHFIGTHDFTSFSHEAHRGCAARDAVRTIRRIDLIKQEGGARLEFEADGFLYKMVRNIVGTLLDLSHGKITYKEIEEIFAAKDRKCAGKTAPAQGLFLVQVLY